MHWRNWRTGGTALALLTAFLISGLWHGASWCFVVWGGLHGLYLAAGVYWQPYRKKLYSWAGVKKGWLLTVWQVFVTFHLVCFSWIFFRAQSLTDAWYVVTHLFAGVSNTRSLLLRYGERELTTIVLVLGVCLAALLIKQRIEWFDYLKAKPFALRWLFYMGFFYTLIFYGSSATSGGFVYFKF
jgi:D-alanyl-lipoteichoic acid acyltransferase DltB (MBOAT superfamily)